MKRPPRWPHMWFIVHAYMVGEFCWCEEEGCPTYKSYAAALRAARELQDAFDIPHGIMRYYPSNLDRTAHHVSPKRPSIQRKAT